jgi:hypothetical protein
MEGPLLSNEMIASSVRDGSSEAHRQRFLRRWSLAEIALQVDTLNGVNA